MKNSKYSVPFTIPIILIFDNSGKFWIQQCFVLQIYTSDINLKSLHTCQCRKIQLDQEITFYDEIHCHSRINFVAFCCSFGAIIGLSYLKTISPVQRKQRLIIILKEACRESLPSYRDSYFHKFSSLMNLRRRRQGLVPT